MRLALLTLAFIAPSILGFSQLTLFEKNYQLAKKLYDKDYVSLFLNRQNLNDQQKQAFLLAIYYQCSTQEVNLSEMKKTIALFTGREPEEDSIKIETEFFKIINQLDKQMHTKDFSFLSELINLP